MPENIITDKIFLGHTPSDQRRFIRHYLEKNKDKYHRVYIPCCGTFSLVKTALEAGYKPEEITCSDISLYSTLIGYYVNDIPISTIPFKVSERVQADLDSQPDDRGRIAVLFYYMKINQYKEVFYEQIRKEQIEYSKDEIIKQFENQLDECKSTYAGVEYIVEDLRKSLVERKGEITIVNPPVITNGYGKMFDFKEDIQYNPSVDEFNWKKEYIGLYEKTQSFDSLYIWYRYHDLEGIDTETVVFAKEYPKRFDYWIVNNPNLFRDEKVYIPLKTKRLVPIKGMEMFTEGEVREDSVIKIFRIKEENALYYRELYAHKLGVTKGEIYVGLSIDGKLFGTAGFMIGDAVRLKFDHVFESYAFSTINLQYPALGRLLMMCLTCKDTQRFLTNQFTKNRIFKINDFKTVCLSKYRKVKKNNNLLTVERREKLGSFYKLHYTTPFYDRSYSDCIKIWLQEIKDGRKY